MNGYIVYNPHNKTVEDLPVIYGVVYGTICDEVQGLLITAENQHLGDHISSDESWSKHDLDVVIQGSGLRQNDFKAKYPDGYRTEFVSYKDHNTHPVIGKFFKSKEDIISSIDTMSYGQGKILDLNDKFLSEIKGDHKNLLLTFTQTIGSNAKLSFLNPESADDAINKYRIFANENVSYADPIEVYGFDEVFFSGNINR